MSSNKSKTAKPRGLLSRLFRLWFTLVAVFGGALAIGFGAFAPLLCSFVDDVLYKVHKVQEYNAATPHLQGNFKPIVGEQHDGMVSNLEVIGTLPEELSGLYLRNGPNLRFEPRNRIHMFDGDALVHGVRILNGKAGYWNR